MRKALRLGTLMVSAAAMAGSASASVQGSFERTYQVSGAVDLQVLTRSGDVIVRTGQRDR
jgi:hypothetical protein